MVDYIKEHDIQTFTVTLGGTDLGHKVGVGDQLGGLHWGT